MWVGVLKRAPHRAGSLGSWAGVGTLFIAIGDGVSTLTSRTSVKNDTTSISRGGFDFQRYATRQQGAPARRADVALQPRRTLRVERCSRKGLVGECISRGKTGALSGDDAAKQASKIAASWIASSSPLLNARSALVATRPSSSRLASFKSVSLATSFPASKRLATNAASSSHVKSESAGVARARERWAAHSASRQDGERRSGSLSQSASQSECKVDDMLTTKRRSEGPASAFFVSSTSSRPILRAPATMAFRNRSRETPAYVNVGGGAQAGHARRFDES